MGEINVNDAFGNFIYNCITKLNLRKVLEIGSSDGTGSTQCFIRAMQSFDEKKLVCIETNKNKFEQLKNNTKEFSWIECINDTTVSVDYLKNISFETIWDSKFNGIKLHPDSNKNLTKSWYDQDIETMSKFGKGYLETNNDSFDCVLIDGGEFVGYQEFLLLKNRTNVFLLDDCYRAYKTKEIVNSLRLDNDWFCVKYEKDLRNGFAAFVKKEFI